MATVIQRFIGLMCGGTLGYVLAMVMGLMVTSWPFNGFFTPLAGVSLVLQCSYWRRIRNEVGGPMRQGACGGLLGVGALWLYYFLG